MERTMTEKVRKHEIEGLLELYSTDPFVFRPAELYSIDGELREQLRNYNIYVVARRPRISINPKSVTLNNSAQTIDGVFSVNLGFEIKEVPFSYPNLFSAPITGLGELEYPYDHLRFVVANRMPVQIRIHDVIRFSETSLQPHSDLFVEYVGQSFGEDGDSDAVARLIGKTGKQGHGSLQKVLADINASNPESEVYLLLYSYTFYKKFMIAGGCLMPEISLDEAPDRFDRLLDARVSREERIDLIEAALIKHFQPKYNDTYKKTFPQKSHEILNVLFDLDITGLSTSLSTEEHNIRIYSKVVEPSNQHCARYPIVQESQRASFFDVAFPSADA